MTVTEIMARAIADGLSDFGGEPRSTPVEWQNATEGEAGEMFAMQAQTVIAALTEADFAIVPVEPTQEMIEAATDEIVVGCCVMDPKSARDTYRAMLATGAAV